MTAMPAPAARPAMLLTNAPAAALNVLQDQPVAIATDAGYLPAQAAMMATAAPAVKPAMLLICAPAVHNPAFPIPPAAMAVVVSDPMDILAMTATLARSEILATAPAVAMPAPINARLAQLAVMAAGVG